MSCTCSAPNPRVCVNDVQIPALRAMYPALYPDLLALIRSTGMGVLAPERGVVPVLTRNVLHLSI